MCSVQNLTNRRGFIWAKALRIKNSMEIRAKHIILMLANKDINPRQRPKTTQ